MIAALSEISGEWNATSSSRNESPTTPAMNRGILSIDVLALVLERRGDAADLGLDPGVAEVLRDRRRRAAVSTRSSVSLSWGEVFGITVMNAASPRSLIYAARPRTRRRAPRRSGRRAPRPRFALGSGQLRRDHERAVRARAEALGVEVVGLTRHRVGRVVAGVREAEPHVERGRRQRQQTAVAGDRRTPKDAAARCGSSAPRASSRRPRSAAAGPSSGIRRRSTFGPSMPAARAGR